MKKVLSRLFGISDPAKKVDSMALLIEEIHHSFKNEHIDIAQSCQNMNDLSFFDENLIKKAASLSKLGFTEAKEVIQARAMKKKHFELLNEYKAKAETLEAMRYFAFKYPNYQFITRQSVKKLCEKYGLVYGPVSNYIGDVPSKNLQEIESMKIDEKDECYTRNSIRDKSNTEFVGFDEYENRFRADFHYCSYNHAPLEIVAPITDFNTKNMKSVDYELVQNIKDPIVLKPVLRNKTKYYLIATAWGIEAKDELVINHKMN